MKKQSLKKFKLGINASRVNSGGGVAYCVGFLKSIKKYSKFISSIHFWCHPTLAMSIKPNFFLNVHVPAKLSKSLFCKILWEKYDLPVEFKKFGCDILLNVDAGSFARVSPCVTVSQDMLSYEKGVSSLFGFGVQRLRIEILKYVQDQSLRFADTSIFLTKYAFRTINTDNKINSYSIIPHGVNTIFKKKRYKLKNTNSLRCIYVSNLLPYKHHIEVIKAFSYLKKKGDIKLDLTIDSENLKNTKYEQKFYNELRIIDCNNKFISCIGNIPNSKLPKLIEKYDIFIFASSCENMPITLIEAMAMGMPICCSDRGPMREILKDAGVYFNPQSPSSIANSISLLWNNLNLRIALSKKALALSKKYSWDKCTKETFSSLKLTLQSHIKKNS
jgi:glycosyltransferase involved in cell wall biosynthesis